MVSQNNELQVKSSHYYLYSAFNNANCVKADLHQLDIKLGGFTSSFTVFRRGNSGEIVSFSSEKLQSSTFKPSRNILYIVFNTSEFPSMGTRTASPRGRYGERPQRDSV